ncbi:hypothetical protein QFC19_004898 [Naganishia cerealis]|uniref:Uncharacterized protein n=1 Tax=Naganishia cerealis TaxID=610337 RepID=A0ACC2VRU4_9TREE|nr:hypothetical protein QFC19_004898 [Naganishia cerealis]
MYQQPNHSYTSAESLRRLSSNNPFRQHAASRGVPLGSLSHSSNSAFDDWVDKNKKLFEESSDEEDYMANGASPMHETFARPKMPAQPVRAGSDSSVNYRYVLTNSSIT